MQKHPVCYYYKCPTTEVEMKFTMESSFGWGVSFPKGIKEYRKLLEANIDIPWPILSAEEQAVVDASYENLHKMIREEDDEQFQGNPKQ